MTNIVSVGAAGMVGVITAGVWDGINRGVGEKMDGREVGDTTKVGTGNGIFTPLHATRKSIAAASIIFLIMIMLQFYIIRLM
jgi:hypothetical protein